MLQVLCPFIHVSFCFLSYRECTRIIHVYPQYEGLQFLIPGTVNNYVHLSGCLLTTTNTTTIQHQPQHPLQCRLWRPICRTEIFLSLHNRPSHAIIPLPFSLEGDSIHLRDHQLMCTILLRWHPPSQGWILISTCREDCFLAHLLPSVTQRV